MSYPALLHDNSENLARKKVNIIGILTQCTIRKIIVHQHSMTGFSLFNFQAPLAQMHPRGEFILSELPLKDR